MSGRSRLFSRSLLTGSLYSLVIQLAGKVLFFGFSYIAIRHAGASAWGAFVIAFTILVLVKNLGLLGMNNSIVKILAESVERKNKQEIFFYVILSLTTVVLSALLFSTVVLLFGSDIAKLFSLAREDLNSTLVPIAFSILPFSVCFICGAILRGFSQVALYAFLTFTATYAFSLFILFLFPAYFGLISIAHSFAVGCGMSAIVGVVLVAMHTKIQMQSASLVEKTDVRDCARYLKEVSKPLYLSGFATIVLSAADVLILGVYHEESEVAIYNIAARFAAMTLLGVSSANAVAAPRLARIHASGDVVGLPPLCKQSALMSGGLSLVIVLPIMLADSQILGLFGDEIQSGVGVLHVLLMGYVFNALSGTAGTVLMMTRGQKTHRNLMLIAMLLNLGLCFALVPTFGAIGAAYATTVAMVFWNLVAVLMVHATYGFWCFFDPFYFFRNRKASDI